MAYLIWLGTRLAGHTELGVRICSVVLSGVAMVFTCRLYERLAPGERRGVAGLLLAQHCVPLFVAGSLLMTIDNPLCCCWIIAMWALYGAVRDGRKSRWIWLGAAFGVGLMAKLAMLFFVPVVLLYLGLSRENRKWLRTPYPYVALLGGCVTLLPQLWWNAQHDWVMLAHQAERVQDVRLDRMLVYPIVSVAGQMGVASPVLFVLMVMAMVYHVRRWRQDASLFVASAVAPAAVFFLGLSLFHRVNENWPAIVYAGLILGAAMHWAPRWGLPRPRRWLVAGFVVGGAIVVLLLWPGLMVRGAGLLSGAARGLGLDVALNADRMPQARVLGWRQMALFAARQAEGATPPAFYMGRRADEASLLAFYLPGQPWVYAHPHQPVSTQYDVWGGWDRLVGRNALLITRLRPSRPGQKVRRRALAKRTLCLFERWGPGVVSDATAFGRVVARHEAWRCEEFRGWPRPRWEWESLQ